MEENNRRAMTCGLEQLRNENLRLTYENLQLKETLKHKKNETAQITYERQQQQQNERLTYVLEQLRNENLQLKETLQHKKNEMTQITYKRQQQQQENERLTYVLEQLRNENLQLKETLQHKENEMAQITYKRQQQQQENERLTYVLEQLRNKNLQHKENEMAQITYERQQQENENLQLKEIIQHQENKHTQLTDNLQMLNNAIISQIMETNNQMKQKNDELGNKNTCNRESDIYDLGVIFIKIMYRILSHDKQTLTITSNVIVGGAASFDRKILIKQFEDEHLHYLQCTGKLCAYNCVLSAVLWTCQWKLGFYLCGLQLMTFLYQKVAAEIRREDLICHKLIMEILIKWKIVAVAAEGVYPTEENAKIEVIKQAWERIMTIDDSERVLILGRVADNGVVGHAEVCDLESRTSHTVDGTVKIYNPQRNENATELNQEHFIDRVKNDRGLIIYLVHLGRLNQICTKNASILHYTFQLDHLTSVCLPPTEPI